MAAKKSAKKKTAKKLRATPSGPTFAKKEVAAFHNPSGSVPAPNPIGKHGVVIGSSNGSFYYVIEKGGKYFYEDSNSNLHELPQVPKSGQGVLKGLTQRGALVADIDRSDTGGVGGYCYLLSVENLTEPD